MHLKGGVFFRQFIERNRHFVLVRASFRLNRNLNDRLREGDRLQNDGMVDITERIAREGIA